MTTDTDPAATATTPGKTHPPMTSLDRWITDALRAELAQRDAAFDFEAGLADIHARAARTRPETTDPAHHATARPGALITSFGYLHGPAPLAEITVDVRAHLHDPHDDPHFRELTGHHPAVQARVLRTPGATGLIDALTAATQALLHGPGSGQRPVRVAIGCAGGRHRSVVLAEVIAARLALAGWDARATHLHTHEPVVPQQPPTPED